MVLQALLAGITHDPCTRFAPQGLGLVFVAVYQRALKLLYVDELLQRVKQDFAKQYQPDQVAFKPGLVSFLPPVALTKAGSTRLQRGCACSSSMTCLTNLFDKR